MRKSKLESCEAILDALLKEPHAIDEIAYETNMECTTTERYVNFLIANGLVEERFSEEETLYAVTERGIAVFKALNFQKYLEKVMKSIMAMDDALQAMPIISKTSSEQEKKTDE